MALSIRLLVVLTAMASVPMAAQAAGVYKCAQPDGRVVFSDHPCTNEQSGGAMKGVAATSPGAPATGGPTTSVDAVRQKAARDRVHQNLSPECRTLGDRASRVLQSDSNASVDEVKRAVSAFEDKCGDQVVEASRKENARGAAGGKNAPLDATACQKLRQSLDADRARLGRMTDKEKMAFAAQQNEVSVACR
jgi:hypothetical protein